MSRILRRIKQMALGWDQLLNSHTPGGWADETISSRAWRQSDGLLWGALRAGIDLVFRAFGQKDHCFESYVSERLRAHFPPELRDKAADHGSV